ncbi:M23 family peptidase, partial [Ralstonia pseudosolanacearum]
MQIILIHPRKAGAVHLSRRQFAVAMGAGAAGRGGAVGRATW